MNFDKGTIRKVNIFVVDSVETVVPDEPETPETPTYNGTTWAHRNGINFYDVQTFAKKYGELNDGEYVATAIIPHSPLYSEDYGTASGDRPLVVRTNDRYAGAFMDYADPNTGNIHAIFIHYFNADQPDAESDQSEVSPNLIVVGEPDAIGIAYLNTFCTQIS
jgi:hypothetical protein